MPKCDMSFGLIHAIPDTATAAWGARMIFPDDLLHDRQGYFADNQLHGDMLLIWLNSGPLNQARVTARRLSNCYELLPKGHDQVTLYEDRTGIIVANPQGSFGYLYVAAYLKDSFIATLDPPQSYDYDDEGKPRRNGVNP